MKLTFALLLICAQAFGQEIKVEYDKDHDFSKYKTFSFGESQVITPPDKKQVSDATLNKWIRNGIVRELEFKGMKYVKDSGDLVVTYAVGTMHRSDSQPIGPLGQTPGSNATTWTRDYNQTSLIIDLSNKANFLAWRINSVADFAGTEGERTIDLIVQRGFKKLNTAARKKKH